MHHAVNHSRRNLFRGRSADTPLPVRPPHALPEADFVAACTGCGDCVRACPQDIILRGSGGYPEIDFSRNECTFCNRCVEACEPEALNAGIQPAWLLRLALADNCLAINQVICQSCADTCDVVAIRFKPQVGAVAMPDIDQQACTGCGACVAICPTGSLSLIPSTDQLAGHQNG